MCSYHHAILFFLKFTATTEIYTLSLHDALPILRGEHAQGTFYVPFATTEGAVVRSYERGMVALSRAGGVETRVLQDENCVDRKSTRPNSSHSQISYAVFCLKKKKNTKIKKTMIR